MKKYERKNIKNEDRNSQTAKIEKYAKNPVFMFFIK